MQDELKTKNMKEPFRVGWMLVEDVCELKWKWNHKKLMQDYKI